MGIIGSKSKSGGQNVRTIKCPAYRKLNEDRDNGSVGEDTTVEDVSSEKDTDELVTATSPPIVDMELTPKVPPLILIDVPISELSNDGDARFEPKSGPSGLHLRSLSLTTQVSPKNQTIPATDGDTVKRESIPDSSLLRPNPILARRQTGIELGAISVGKLGNKQKVRKSLEKQGLISETASDAKGEGILSELREVGILQQGSANTDDGYMCSTGAPRRRLPQRLAEMPPVDLLLPNMELSLPNRLRQLKFGISATENERFTDVPLLHEQTLLQKEEVLESKLVGIPSMTDTLTDVTETLVDTTVTERNASPLDILDTEIKVDNIIEIL